jgi:transcriptional regulator with XRE-family HTH domain
MVIGARLKKLRESKALSQGDIEKRTGLLRCYISRVENGHTVPAVPTLEKMARALEVPMYQLFHDGDATESVRKGKFSKLCKLLAKMEHDDQKLLLNVAQKVAKRVVSRPGQSKGN